MHTLVLELRQAWRSLRARRLYFFTCVATLALVLGANAAIFAVANATMLRPMPFDTAAPVVHLFAEPPGTTATLQRNPLQQMEVSRLRARARTLARLEGFYLTERVVTLAGEPSVAQSAAVTPGLLTMMATPIALGRPFLEAEGEPGHVVALITDRYWRDALGAAPVLGTPLVIDGQPHTIVGVIAPGFAVPFLEAQVFTPLVASPEPKPRAPALTVVGLAELAPGATLAQARDELRTISAELAQEFPRTHTHWTLGVQSARQWQYGSMRAPLLLLLAATAFVLLIACVNVANLTSAHAVSRSGELAMRLALGASRRDLLRTQLAELLIVATAAVVPALVLAGVTIPALLAINPTVARALGPVAVDWRVIGASLLAALLTALVVAVWVTLRATRGQASAVLAVSSTRTTTAPASTRAQRVLLSLEVALSVALLMAAAVVLQGLRDLADRSPGYQYAGVLTGQIRLPEVGYPTPEARAAVVDRLITAMRALPGVEAVGTTQNAFIPTFSYQTMVRVRDRPTADDQPHTVQFRRVSPDYFHAMRVRTMAGRVFTDADTLDRPAVAVVSRRFAATLLPGLDPIGQVLLRSTPQPLTIVGVVDDVSDVTVTVPPEPTLYLPWSQNNAAAVPVAFVVRTTVEPGSLVPAMRAALREVDPSLPLRKPQPLAVFVDESTAPDRFRSLVLALLAGLGLVLAAVGIAGVTSHGVIDRRRDFAVRLALGSAPRALLGLVVGEAMRDLAIGAATGVAVGAALCALLVRSLENVAAIDATLTGAAVALIVSVGVAAAALPARRVLQVDAAAVLRS